MKKSMVLWARQYSKRLLAFLLTVWVFGAVIGAIYEFIRLVAAPDTASMGEYYIYLAVPLTCGIPSYIIPNIFLNKEKVKQGYDPAYDQKYLEGCGIEEDGIGEAPVETQQDDNDIFGKEAVT